ncbi:MAG: CPBP family intramembrane metalloprotease [Microlunatus sp.]
MAESTYRRRLVVAATLVLGTVGSGLMLAVPPGDPLFYPATLGVAALWITGAFASGPLHLGWAQTRTGTPSRGIVQGFIVGVMLLAVFLLGAFVIARIPLLRAPVDDLLDHARHGSLWLVAVVTIVSGIAEELFFRGAVFAALPQRVGVLGSTVLYAASTFFSGVPLLTFAAVCLGLLTAVQRRVTGGVVGPITIHLTWSLGMLLLLGPVLNSGG